MGVIDEKFAWDGQIPRPENMKFTFEDANALSNNIGGGSATITIKPHNSLYDGGANVELTGIDDHILINAALGSGNLDVFFLDGTVNPSANINVMANMRLRGAGRNLTLFDFSAGFFNIHNKSNVEMQDFSITNKGGLIIAGTTNQSNFLVKNVRIYDTTMHWFAFHVYVTACTFENVEFNGCFADNTEDHGFFMDGTPAHDGLIKGLRVINCHARNCARDHAADDWTVGFDVAENVNLENALFDGCTAARSCESGFHTEGDVGITNLSFINCHSWDNGLVKASPTFGRGFTIGGDVQFIGCTAVNNRNEGFFIDQEDNVPTPSLPNIVNIATEGNGDAGLTLRYTNNMKVNLASKGDKYGLVLDGHCSNLDIDADIIAPTNLAIKRWTAVYDTDHIEDSAFKLLIIDSTGDGTSGLFLHSIKNTVFDITTRNANSISRNLYFRYLTNCDFKINSELPSGDSKYAFACMSKMDNINVEGIFRGGCGINCNSNSGDICVKNASFHDIFRVFFLAGLLTSGVINIDEDSIIYDSITDKIGGDVADSYLHYVSTSNSATITSANTSVTVTHLLAHIPEYGDIVVTPRSNIGNATKWWVDSYTTTQFTIHVDAAPGSDIIFGWRARLSR